MPNSKVVMGIDPGINNLGWAILFPKDQGEAPLTGVLNSTEIVFDEVHLSVFKATDRNKFKGLVTVVETLLNRACFSKVEKVVIERYVAYESKLSAIQEDMNILIGLIAGYFYNNGIEVVLTRATDWKTSLTHHLVRSGWKNPHQGRGKDFSYEVCKELTGMVPDTDHEADALCLAALGRIEE